MSNKDNLTIFSNETSSSAKLVNPVSSEAEIKQRTLGKSDLWAIGVGQVIGAGVISLTGIALGLTGKSVWLAYAVAVIYGFIVILPNVFLSATLRLKGGNYSLITSLANDVIGGMYIVAFIASCIGISLFGVSLGSYAQSIFPKLNIQFVGIVFMTLFFVINIFGVDIMAKTQKYMSVILVVCLLLFVIFGMTKVDSSIFNFSSPEFITHGSSGFIAAVFLLVYSTQGYVMNINYGMVAKDAKRDIPWSILMCVPVIFVVYVGVAMVDAGVLPLAQVAGKPLTLAAKTILPAPLFIAFIVGGPIMALMTTLNSTYAAYSKPFQVAAKDGWLPESFARTNKYGVPYKIMTAVYIVGLIPIALNFNISTITNNIMLVNIVLNYLVTFSTWRLPYKFPEQWNASRYHIPNWGWHLMMSISLIANTAIIINSIKTLNIIIVVASLSVIAVCMLYAVLRFKKGHTHVEHSYTFD